MQFRFGFIVAGVLAASGAAAQDYSVEELAVVRESETVNFDAQSIRELGALTRFEVMIRYKDPSQSPPGGPAARQVRYAARCADASSVITGVALIDDSGRMIKNIIVPPGGAEFAKPAADSREAQWVKRVCGR